MRKFLSASVFIADILFFALYTQLIMNSANLALNALLIFISLVAVVFLKSLNVDEEARTMKFKKKEFFKLFFTENMIKFLMIMSFMLWFNKLASGFDCFLIILASFAFYGICTALYYWLIKKNKTEWQTK